MLCIGNKKSFEKNVEYHPDKNPGDKEADSLN